MTIRKYVWLESHADKTFIDEVRGAGVREAARACKCSPALVSRWLRSQTGIAYEKFDKVLTALGSGPGKAR